MLGNPMNSSPAIQCDVNNNNADDDCEIIMSSSTRQYVNIIRESENFDKFHWNHHLYHEQSTTLRDDESSGEDIESLLNLSTLQANDVGQQIIPADYNNQLITQEEAEEESSYQTIHHQTYQNYSNDSSTNSAMDCNNPWLNNDNNNTWQTTDQVDDQAVTTHTPNVCQICGKFYSRPSTLKTHLRTHSGERPYKCLQCDKAFSQTANLTAHMRTHSGEKPFKCFICNRRFSQSSSVTTHMRTHSGEKPYTCSVCYKAFSDSSTLTKHTRVHSGEKPYRCGLCYAKFSQSGNLNRHLKVHLNAQIVVDNDIEYK